MLIYAMIGVAWASGASSDDPWAAWRTPAQIVTGRVNSLVKGEESIEIVISDDTVNPRLTTVRYPRGFSFSFTPPSQGDMVLVSVMANPRDSTRLDVQALFQSASTRYGLVLLDGERTPVAGVWCDTGVENAYSAAPLVPIAPDAPRVPPSEDDVLLSQALPWANGVALVQQCSALISGASR